MSNTEKQMTEQESLQIITNMINTVRKDASDNGHMLLLWGYAVLIAALGHYLFAYHLDIQQGYLFWLLMPLCGIITAIVAYRDSRKTPRVESHVERLFGNLVVAFVIPLIIVLAFQGQLREFTYPIILLLYGIFLYLAGAFLRFKPLLWGGAANWPIAIVCMFVPFEIQLLLMAGAVLIGYIIPGHILKARYRDVQRA